MPSGKVAALLTDRTLAVSCGTDDGVSVGYAGEISNLVKVLDPDSGDSLGTVEVPRVSVKVESVQPKLCVVKIASFYISRDKRYLKHFTNDPDLEDFKTIFVRIGDYVGLYSDEPPF